MGWDPHAWGQLGGLDPHVLSVTSHVHVSPGSLSPGCWPYKQLIWGSLQPQTPVLMGGTPREGPQCPSEVSGAAAVGGTGMAQRWHVAPQRRGGDRERPDVPWAGARGVLPVPSRCWQGQPHIPMAGSRGGTHRWVPHTCPRCHRPRSPPLAAPGASGVSQNSPSGAIKAGRARGGEENGTMVGPGVMGGSKGLLSARLGCSVQEEDVGRRETFSAEWLDLELRTRPEDG